MPFLEKIYEKALVIEFKKEEIPAVSQAAVKNPALWVGFFTHKLQK